MAHSHHENVRPHDNFAAHEEDQVDPHGFDSGHKHGHVILPLMTLRLVLVSLLVLTAATVFASRAEHMAQEYFHIVLPGWVNVIVALSIAFVKAVIVAMIFMQLRYDNPINSVIFLFCIFGVILFMGFTAMDLGVRNRVYRWKAGEVIQGGTGGTHINRYEKQPDGTEVRVSPNEPLYLYARERLLEKVGQEKFDELEHEAHAHGGPHARPDATSPWKDSANQSRARTGTTPGLFDTTPPASGEHGAAEHGASEKGAGEHGSGH